MVVDKVFLRSDVANVKLGCFNAYFMLKLSVFQNFSKIDNSQ